LQQVEGLTVIPVNRVLAAMSELKMLRITGPEDALTVADKLAVDSVIVGSITQYDPYPPPKVGMAVQEYVRASRKSVEEPDKYINPGQLARAGKNLDIPFSPELRPRVGVTRIIDADNKEVVKRIKEYAESRTGEQRPSSWKSYTTQRNYLRFVAHEIIGELLASEQKLLEAQQKGDEQHERKKRAVSTERQSEVSVSL
jgi:hypothetical protein